MDLEITDIDMALTEGFPVPDLRQCALLLDIDGTILDLAPAPQEVWVPAELRKTLSRLNAATGGALALVSGRSLHDIDLIFSPLQLAAIGGHGRSAIRKWIGRPEAEARTVSPFSPSRRRQHLAHI